MKKLLIILLLFGCKDSRQINSKPTVPIPNRTAYYYLLPDSIPKDNFNKTVSIGRYPYYVGQIEFSDAEKQAFDIKYLEDMIFGFPKNINVDMPDAVVTQIRAVFRNKDIPAYWMHGETTWSEFLIFLEKYGQFHQRFHQMSRGKLLDGITLDTQYKNLSPEVQKKLLAVADSYAIDKSGLSADATMKEILKVLVDRMVL